MPQLITHPAAADVADVDLVHGRAPGAHVLDVCLFGIPFLLWSSSTSTKGMIPWTSGSAAYGGSSVHPTLETTALQCR